MPPTIAVRACGSTSSTLVKADTSRVTTSESPPSRNRNRFDVDLASLTGVPGGMAAYWCLSLAAAACLLASRGLVVPGRGAGPPVSPAPRGLAVLARGDDPPEPPAP